MKGIPKLILLGKFKMAWKMVKFNWRWREVDKALNSHKQLSTYTSFDVQ